MDDYLSSPAEPSDRHRTLRVGMMPRYRAPAVALALTVLLGVLLVAFTWPAVRTRPRDVPIAVAGPAPVVAQFIRRVDPDAFDITRVPDAAAARDLIRDEDVYGAFILGRKPQLLTASAAGPVVAQTLTGMAGPGMAVRDIRPMPADDPRGWGLSNAVMPLVFASIAAAVLITVVIPGRPLRVAAALGFAVVAGFVMIAILRFWLGAIDDNYWATSGVAALGIGASSLLTVGLVSVFGLPGLGMGTGLLMLLGNPLSAQASAPEMLPTGWGTLGQLLPPGATGALIRSTAYFGTTGCGCSAIVLGGWLLLGTTFTMLGTRGRLPLPRLAVQRVPVERPAS